MRAILLLAALSLGLSACQESAPVASESSAATVTLAPRIVRTAAVPVPLFDGTDRVGVEVYDAVSGALLKSVSTDFDLHSLDVVGIPADARVRVDVYGYDPSGNIVWYGVSSSLSASEAASGIGVNLDISITPYQADPTPYLGEWVYVNGTGMLEGTHSGSWTTVARFGDDGQFHWENFFVNASGDVLSRYVSEGRYVQVGTRLSLTPSETRTCGAAATYPSGTCNSDASLASGSVEPWTADFTKGASGLVVMIGTAEFPFGTPATSVGRYPVTGTWNHSHEGTISPVTGINLDGTWATSVRFAADGSYIWVQMFSVGTTGRIAKHYIEIGSYVKTGTNIAFTPSEASSCDAGLEYLTVSCAEVTDGSATTPDPPSTWGYEGNVGTMVLTSPGGNPWEFTKQATALGEAL